MSSLISKYCLAAISLQIAAFPVTSLSAYAQQSEPIAESYSHAQKFLDRIHSEIAALRDRASSALQDHDYQTGYAEEAGSEARHHTAASIAEMFGIIDEQKVKNSIEELYIQAEDGTIDRDDYYKKTYAILSEHFDRAWGLVLRETGSKTDGEI
jgi:hypothetical protein